MRKKIYVNFVLDETGSMGVCRTATIDGFNEFLQGLRRDQQDTDQDVRFTLTKFNSTAVVVVHDAAPLSEVKELTQATYRPYDLTPLYDAIMTTIRTTEKAIEGEDDVAVLCSIMTDGEENASVEHTREDVFRVIKEKTAEGWTFTYLAANQDAWIAGGKIGIARGNVEQFTSSPTGTRSAMGSHTHATSVFMASGGLSTSAFYSSTEGEEEEDD